ncbi:DUF2867 domain-containing protein [Undibacterium squillarum]|uniref:DUF2867 domain-containing protein n=1 Tax=Undibacterium squillarum TaxID=1131567 RepID=UPI0035AF7F87
MSSPFLSSMPADSRLRSCSRNADFHDSWSVHPADPGITTFAALQAVFMRSPRWIANAMALRNKVVSKLGLKDLGGFDKLNPEKPLSAYRIGDRLGIFTLLSVSDEEIVMGDDDKHLQVQVSVYRDWQQNLVTVSTVVHVKNWFGHLYMLPVKPAHRRIVPATLRVLTR